MDDTVPHVRPWYRRWPPVLIGLAVVVAAGASAVAVIQVANPSTGRTSPVAAKDRTTAPAFFITEPPSQSPTSSPTATAAPTPSTTRSSRPRTTQPPPGGGSAPDHVPDIQLLLTTDQYVGERIGLRTVRARVDVKNATKSHRATVVIRWRENGKEIARATRVVTGSGRFTVTFQHEYQNCGQEQSAYVTVDGSHREAVTIAEGIDLIGWICNG